MNKIWLYLVLMSSIALIITKPENMLPAIMDSSYGVVKLCIEFCAIYSVWLGLLEILDASGLSEKISNLLKPIIKKLFKTSNNEAIKQISISLSANMLGLANAATPSAINAMHFLDDKSGKINYSMLMFVVISSCSIQLLPTTIISMRQSAGSLNAADIILPTLIATFFQTATGIFLTIILSKIKRKHWYECLHNTLYYYCTFGLLTF